MPRSRPVGAHVGDKVTIKKAPKKLELMTE